MSDIDTDQQAVPADTGVPAAPPTATESAAPEPTSETSGDDTPASQGEKEKPKGGFQRRISELTRQQRELREELARERAAREAMERKGQSAEPPKRDDFASWDEYERANVAYVARQVLQEERTKAATEAQQEALQRQAAEIHQSWESKLDAARDTYDDIDEYVDAVGEQLTPVLAEAIKAAEKAPELVRHLGQHPKDLERLQRLPAVQAVYELARIEARLQAQPKASAAPAPASPVRTASAPANPLRDDSDIGAWMKARRQQVRG